MLGKSLKLESTYVFDMDLFQTEVEVRFEFCILRSNIEWILMLILLQSKWHMDAADFPTNISKNRNPS